MKTKADVIAHIEGLLGNQGSTDEATRVFNILLQVDGRITFDPQHGFVMASLDENEWLDILQRIDTAKEPATIYSWDSEHPDYPKKDWQYEVANNDTLLGYNDWVRNQVDAAAEERQ